MKRTESNRCCEMRWKVSDMSRFHLELVSTRPARGSVPSQLDHLATWAILDTIAPEFRLLPIPINLPCINPLNSPSLPQTMHG